MLQYLAKDWIWWSVIGVVLSAHIAAVVWSVGDAERVTLPPVVEGKTTFELLQQPQKGAQAAQTKDAPPQPASSVPNAPTLPLGGSKVIVDIEAERTVSELTRRQELPVELATKVDSEIRQREVQRSTAQPATSSRADQGKQLPVPIGRLTPNIPASLSYAGAKAWTKVRFRVEVSGKTANVVVIDSSGHSAWDNAVKQAITKWRFRPAMKNGRPISQVVLHRVNAKVPE